MPTARTIPAEYPRGFKRRTDFVEPGGKMIPIRPASISAPADLRPWRLDTPDSANHRTEVGESAHWGLREDARGRILHSQAEQPEAASELHRRTPDRGAITALFRTAPAVSLSSRRSPAASPGACGCSGRVGAGLARRPPLRLPAGHHRLQPLVLISTFFGRWVVCSDQSGLTPKRATNPNSLQLRLTPPHPLVRLERRFRLAFSRSAPLFVLQ